MVTALTEKNAKVGLRVKQVFPGHGVGEVGVIASIIPHPLSGAQYTIKFDSGRIESYARWDSCVIVSGSAGSTGCTCKLCNLKNDYALPNQPNNEYICFECR